MPLIRNALLWASTNPWMRNRATRTAFVRRSVAKFMPGETVEAALDAARSLQPLTISTILTRLGENLESIDEAVEVADHYRRVIDMIATAELDAQVSIKPTQLGYDQDPDVCFGHCETLLKQCEAHGNLFWLDMESSAYADGTLTLFKRLREVSPNVGVAIQAYLYRSEQDVEELVQLGSAIRLVKGAYLEPPAVAFPKKSDVDQNYFKLATRLLKDDNVKPGALTHIATHDTSLQERLIAYASDRRVSSDRYEIAMLYGIQARRQEELGRVGVNTRVLISYGAHWFPWYMRRLAERPANIGFVVKNMFR